MSRSLISLIGLVVIAFPYAVLAFHFIPLVFRRRGRLPLSGHVLGALPLLIGALILATNYRIWVRTEVGFYNKTDLGSYAVEPAEVDLLFYLLVNISGFALIGLIVVTLMVVIFLPVRRRCPVCATFDTPHIRYCRSCGHDFETVQPRLWRPIAARAWRWIGIPLIILSTFLIGGLLAALLTQSNITLLTPANSANAQTEIVYPTATPYEYTRVLIAVETIPYGTRLGLDQIDFVDYPANMIPVGLVTNLDDVVGKVALTDIARERVLLSNMFGDDLPSSVRYESRFEGPAANSSRGPLRQRVSGILTWANWTEAWDMVGCAGNTIRLAVLSDHPESFPAIMVWSLKDEQWIDGERHAAMGGLESILTVTLPHSGMYQVTVSRPGSLTWIAGYEFTYDLDAAVITNGVALYQDESVMRVGPTSTPIEVSPMPEGTPVQAPPTPTAFFGRYGPLPLPTSLDACPAR